MGCGNTPVSEVRFERPPCVELGGGILRFFLWVESSASGGVVRTIVSKMVCCGARWGVFVHPRGHLRRGRFFDLAGSRLGRALPSVGAPNERGVGCHAVALLLIVSTRLKWGEWFACGSRFSWRLPLSWGGGLGRVVIVTGRFRCAWAPQYSNPVLSSLLAITILVWCGNVMRSRLLSVVCVVWCGSFVCVWVSRLYRPCAYPCALGSES